MSARLSAKLETRRLRSLPRSRPWVLCFLAHYVTNAVVSAKLRDDTSLDSMLDRAYYVPNQTGYVPVDHDAGREPLVGRAYQVTASHSENGVLLFGIPGSYGRPFPVRRKVIVVKGARNCSAMGEPQLLGYWPRIAAFVCQQSQNSSFARTSHVSQDRVRSIGCQQIHQLSEAVQTAPSRRRTTSPKSGQWPNQRSFAKC